MIRRTLLWPLAAVALLCFSYSFALADAAGAAVVVAANPLTTFAFWAPMIATVLGVLGNRLRAWTPSTGLFHTNTGHLVIMAICAALGALSVKIGSGVFGWQSLSMAVVSALAGWLGALKTTSSDAAILNGKLAALLVPLVFLGALSGCGPFGTAYKACLKTASPGAVAQDVTQIPNQVQSVLTTNADAGAIAAALAAISALYTDGDFLVGCAETAWQTTHPNATPVQTEAIKRHRSKNPAAARLYLCGRPAV